MTEHPYSNSNLRQNVSIHDEKNVVTIFWQIPWKEDSVKFQLKLFSDGRIVFCYEKLSQEQFKDILSDTRRLQSVQIGLSDSILYEQPDKKIGSYQYHNFDLKEHSNKIYSGVGLIFTPKATCNTAKTCHSCTSLPSNLGCVWCPALQMCSNGLDRNRLVWDKEVCYLSHVGIRETVQCPVEMVISNDTFYHVVYHQTPPPTSHIKFGKAPVGKLLSLPFIMQFFEENINGLVISDDGTSIMLETGMKTNSTYPFNYKFIRVIYSPTSNIQYAITKLLDSDSEKSFILKFSYSSEKNLQIILRPNNQIYFHFTNIPFVENEKEIGLYHGIFKSKSGIVDMATSLISFSKSDIPDAHLAVLFIPKSHCSMSHACWKSNECEQYSTLNGCKRFQCPTKNLDNGNKCGIVEVTRIQSYGHSALFLGLGVGGAVTLVLLVIGVLGYNITHLDNRMASPISRWLTAVGAGFGYSRFLNSGQNTTADNVPLEDTDEISL